MNRILSSTTAIALVMAASSASAAVTPEEVWASWQALATSSGQELTFDKAAMNGGAFEVTGLAMTYKDDLGGSFAADLGKMTFKDNGDGTVTVTMADSYPMSLAFPGDGEGPTSLKLTVTQPGLAITASGTPEATSYAFKAPTVTVKLDEVKGADGVAMDTQADLKMTDTTAAYMVARDGDKTSLDSNFAAKAMSLDISGKGVDGSGAGTVAVSFADLSGSTKGTFLGAEIMANMATALNEGFTANSSFSFGEMKINFDITDEMGPSKLTGGATGGGLNLAIDRKRVNYGTSLKGGNFTISGAQIPFPQVVVGFAETGFNIDMPVAPSDDPQDFGFLTKLVDLTISEDVWGMFDPTGSLSRDPATFIFDVKGKGKWKQDIMDPKVEAESVEPPGELNALDLTQVLVKAAGAEVGATGGVTFDNSDLVSFQGMPTPTGEINVSIKGVTKLIDNLIAMGILPEDQAMGARMMLGMFAKPGAGPDELTSLIEFKNGGLFANGQQLQ
jgi:Uncharacterized protein conserved in bacteria (DUF2125)